MEEKELAKPIDRLTEDLKQLINEARQKVAVTVNAETSLLYWNVGWRIKNEVLENERAGYGKQIVLKLSQKLTEEYGKGWSEKQLRHCLCFAETFQDYEMVYALSRQLSWTHFRTLIYIEDDLSRDFYTQMCQYEGWTTRVLAEKIDSMLYERTAISRKPEKQIESELRELRDKQILSPDLVFKDPYVLDFLGLENNFSEKNLEEAILKELEKFILELGQGFTFVERQKRMLIDGENYKLDLLFYHRKLKGTSNNYFASKF